MATIGTFKKSATTSTRRDRHSLGPGQERPHRSRNRPLQRNAPSHRVFVAGPRSAPRAKRSNEGREYLASSSMTRASTPRSSPTSSRRGRRRLQPDLVPPSRRNGD